MTIRTVGRYVGNSAVSGVIGWVVLLGVFEAAMRAELWMHRRK